MGIDLCLWKVEGTVGERGYDLWGGGSCILSW